MQTPAATLSGKPPKNPPHFTLFKFIPDGLSIFQLIAENAEAQALFAKLFPGLDTTPGIDAIGQAVNPDVLDTTSDDGAYQQAVFGPGLAQGPAATHITYALVFSNDGGFSADDVVLTDRVPLGTKFDATSTYAPTYNGRPFDRGQMTISPDGRSLHFDLGTITPDKFNANGTKAPNLGLVLYTVDVLPARNGGISPGSAIQAQGGALATTSLLQTTYAQPAEIDTVVTAPGAAYLESYKGTAQAVIGRQIPYDIYYRNSGGLTPEDFRIVDALPAGTTFVSAAFLAVQGAHHVVRNAQGGKGESIDHPAGGASSGDVTFHLGAVKPGEDGWVRLVVKVKTTATNVSGLLIANNPMVPADVFPSSTKRAFTAPHPEADASKLIVPTASTQNASRLVTPAEAVLEAGAAAADLPHLNVGITVPMSVQEGSTYDCLVFVANTTDTLIGKTEVFVPVPAGAEFVSAGDGPFKGVFLAKAPGGPVVLFQSSVHDDAGNFIDNEVQPHSATLYHVVLRAANSSAGKALTTNVYTASTTYNSGENGVAVAPVYSTNASTYVIGRNQTFADAASQIVTSGLEANGSSAVTLGSDDLQKRIAQLTPTALGHGLGGADLLALNNDTVIVPLGNGQVTVVGPTANLAVASGVTSIISQDGSGIVAQGGGNLITALNLIDGNGSSIVAQGGGNLQSMLAGLISRDGNSIVAQGGGNLLNLGGGNIISQDGTGVISNDGGSLTLINLAGIVAQGGGNIVAAGGGNIVAQGGGNIVAQGGGNIVAQGGGNIVAQGGGNVINAGGGLINISASSFSSPDATVATSAAGAGIVAAGGGNIVAQGGGNIVAQGGGN